MKRSCIDAVPLHEQSTFWRQYYHSVLMEKFLKIQLETFMEGYFVTILLTKQRILSLLWNGSKDLMKEMNFA